MTPAHRRRRATRQRRLIDRVLAKLNGGQIVTIILSLTAGLGGCWKAQQSSEGVREQVAQVENRAEFSKGKTRLRVDTLETRLAALEGRVERMRRTASAAVISDPAESGFIGPPAPAPRRGNLLATLTGWFRREPREATHPP